MYKKITQMGDMSNVRTKNIKLPEENIGENLWDIVWATFFFLKIQHQRNKPQNRTLINCTSIKIMKSVFHFHQESEKIAPRMGENFKTMH